MKKVLFAALALMVCFASCVKDNQYPGVNITNVSYSPTAVTESTPVTVKAVITCFNQFTATLYYKDAALQTTEMTAVEMIPANEKDTYAAIIPAMADGTTVTFYVKAISGKFEAISPAMEYTVGAVQIDYSVLRLNELNGNDKFIEIYNAGNETIDLKGCYIEKDNTQNWIDNIGITLAAGEYLLLYSKDVVNDHPEIPANQIFDSGLSAKKNVRIQLFTPAGISIDDFNLVDIQKPAPASYSLNADGLWYHADATPGAANVEGTELVEGLEGGEPVPPTPDYTNIVLNELNGDTKFIEIYNMGDMDLPLEGMFITKDAGTEPTWTADATIVAPAHGYVLLYSEDVQTDHPEVSANMFFGSGLSAKKTIQIALFMPDGTVRDIFERGTTGEWGQTISNVSPKSYARTPDGGDWKLAEPTPGAANPADGEEIPQE